MRLVALMKFYAQELCHHGPLLPGVAPYGDRVQVLKRMEVALVHCLLFFQIDLADEVAIIATNNIRIIFGHFETTSGGWPIVELL